MKLNEILISNKVVKYDRNSSNERWIVVDESMNRVISKHKTKESANNFIGLKRSLVESGTPVDYTNFSVGEIFQIGTGRDDRVGIGLGSREEILEFTNDGTDVPRNQRQTGRQKAQAFLDALDPADRTDQAAIRSLAESRGMRITNWRGMWGTLDRRAASATARSFDDLKRLPVLGPTLSRMANSTRVLGLFRILAVVGTPATLVIRNFEVINDLELEAEQNPQDRDELVELRNIIVSQTIAQIGLLLYMIMRQTSLFNRALSAIKWTVRAIQGSAALTGVGTIPSALSFLLTESAWLVAGWIITSPTVQRALAEWIQDTIVLREIFAYSGAAVVAGAGFLDAAFDGQFGTGALRDSLGFGPREAEAAPEGEYHSTSEWAKLVFHGLLFPPGREQMLVPYIAPEQRARLLREAMNMEPEAAQPETSTDDTTTTQPEAEPTSEPGLPTNPDARPGPQ